MIPSGTSATKSLLFDSLTDAFKRPLPYEDYTARELWTDSHISGKMLELHLDPFSDSASRRHDFIDASVDWIRSRFNIQPGSRILDAGCGPGLYTTRLARHGACVTGIDFSVRSIEYAKKEMERLGLEIRYINDDYLTYRSDEKFDLIMMIMCDFTALSPPQRQNLLASFRTMLAPGGEILLDVYSYRYFDSYREGMTFGKNLMNQFWSEEEYYCFLGKYKYETEKLLLDKYTIITGSGTRHVYNWYQCFDENAIRREFALRGFTVTALYTSVAGEIYRGDTDGFAVTARCIPGNPE